MYAARWYSLDRAQARELHILIKDDVGIIGTVNTSDLPYQAR